MSLEERVRGQSAALERLRIRHEALVGRMDELTRRVDRIEIRLMLYALGGGAAGAVLGTAGSAAALTFLGG